MVAKRPTRKLVASGVRGSLLQAALVSEFAVAGGRGAGLNRSRFGRTQSDQTVGGRNNDGKPRGAPSARQRDAGYSGLCHADPASERVDGRDFRSPADYSVDLDAAQLRDIAAAMRRINAAGIGLDGLQREHFEVPSLRPFVEEIRRQVEDGRGFVLLRGLPVEDYSKDDLGLIFWGIGTHLGRGLSQSVMGDRLGHVKDFSREDPGARAYRNKQELSPHTDSCDLVGLLCLRNAQAGGGVSRLTSAISVHNALLAENPDVLAALYRGYVRHRRGEEQPGELPYTPYRIPVYSNVEGKVSVRYVRSYIEAGEAAAGRPMGAAERAIIDTFEAVTKRPELMLEFTLQPGEAYFINNYTILHARTAFDDGDAPEDARRHLLRLWLDTPVRPVHPYIRSRGILPVAGRTPSFDWSSITAVRH